MTAYNLIKTLTKRGNSVIGSGCYAAALSSTVDCDKVIKIGNNTADPWLDYLAIIKQNTQNPCVPRIHSFYLDTEHNFYVCVMERLKETVGDATAKAATELCKEFVESWHTDEDFLRLASAFQKQIPYPTHMLALLNMIKEQTDCFKTDGVDSYCNTPNGRMLDLHDGNFMLRDGAIIVTDPWCEADMCDISDVTAWAEQNNIV